jgi:hypothetical protein
MTQSQTAEEFRPTGWRFRIGFAFFVLGWICPLFVPLVTSSNLSPESKTLLSGLLILGGPEILSVVSIVFLGKAGFNYIKSKAFALMKRAVPRGEVGRLRYRIGLLLLLPHVVFASLIYNTPHLIPLYDEHRIGMNLFADFLFVVTLFILGGDFWEKLRALFYYDMKVHIPQTG